MRTRKGKTTAKKLNMSTEGGGPSEQSNHMYKRKMSSHRLQEVTTFILPRVDNSHETKRSSFEPVAKVSGMSLAKISSPKSNSAALVGDGILPVHDLKDILVSPSLQKEPA